MWFNIIIAFPPNQCYSNEIIMEGVQYGWAWNETAVRVVKELRLSEAANICKVKVKMSLAPLGLAS